MLEQSDTDHTTAKERLSSDKVLSAISLFVGQRAHQFDALLQRVPTSQELTRIAERLGKGPINNAIFDVDGTLVPPYANATETALDTLRTYREGDRKMAIYTNSPHSQRLEAFREAGVQIAHTGRGKPSLRGFQILCEQCAMNPSATVMIGNSALTDMPLAPKGEAPLFPINILVQSIPPERKLTRSYRQYVRAQAFHVICMAAAKVVLFRNRHILRDIA